MCTCTCTYTWLYTVHINVYAYIFCVWENTSNYIFLDNINVLVSVGTFMFMKPSQNVEQHVQQRFRTQRICIHLNVTVVSESVKPNHTASTVYIETNLLSTVCFHIINHFMHIVQLCWIQSHRTVYCTNQVNNVTCT